MAVDKDIDNITPFNANLKYETVITTKIILINETITALVE